MTQKRKQKRILLSVKRFKQQGNECAVASVSSIANYYDRSVKYKEVRRLLPKEDRKDGLFTPQQGLLFNQLGYGQVTIVTFDLDIFDFSWNRLTTAGIIRRLKSARIYWKKNKKMEQASLASAYIEFLQCKECKNKVVIDNNLPKYIKRDLRNGRPVGASFNYNSLWKTSKGGMAYGKDFRSETTEHAVVIRGYDDVGLFIVDSNQPGYYKIKWSDFLLNTGTGDLILVR